MSDTNHTPGALRAAKKIINIVQFRLMGSMDTEKMADLIDRETHGKELLEALKGLVGTIDSFATNVDCSKAKAVIAKAEKEAADGPT